MVTSSWLHPSATKMIMIKNKDPTVIMRDTARKEAKASSNTSIPSFSSSALTTSGSSASHPNRFPFRLNDMLNDAEIHGNDHIVSWLPGNRMFKVHRHKEFANKIMPLYCRHKHYKSFLRQLSMYKFQRINEGPLRGCYHHPNFERNRFDLIEKINRQDRDTECDKVASNKSKEKGRKGPTQNTVKQPQQPPSTKLDSFASSHQEGGGDTASYSEQSGSDNDEFELIDFSKPPAEKNVTDDFIASGIGSSSRQPQQQQQQQERKPQQRPLESEFDKPQQFLEQMLLPNHSYNLAASNNISVPLRQPVFHTMRQMSQQPGLFHVQPEQEESKQGNSTSSRTRTLSTSNSMMPLSASSAPSTSTARPTVFSQQPLVFLSDAPTDVVDEIIRTFGRNRSTKDRRKS